MRIISGKHRGRKLKTLAGNNTRPTTDKVKEAMFNLLGIFPKSEKSVVLDLFAGSGALAIEAISRGANQAVLVDSSGKALQIAKENVAKLSENSNTFHFYKSDAKKILPVLAKENWQFSLVFLDPPYAKQKIVEQLLAIEDLNLLASNAQVIAETSNEVELPAVINFLKLKKQRTYGITKVWLYNM